MALKCFERIVNFFNKPVDAKLKTIDDQLNSIELKINRIELYSMTAAKRFAVSCGQGRILIRSSVGYVLVNSKDYPLASILIEAQELEPGVRLLLEKLIEPGFVVVDVGANIGMHTITMSKRLRNNGVVHAFEPMPETVELLSENLSINGCSENTTIYQIALSNINDRKKLHLGRTSGHHSLYPLEGEVLDGDLSELKVEVAMLDTVLENEPYIDLIKIDAEGAELAVLEGAYKLIERSPDVAIIAEFGPSHLQRIGVSIEDWLSHFTNLGFKWFVVNDLTGALEDWTISQLSNIESTNLFFARNDSRFLNREVINRA